MGNDGPLVLADRPLPKEIRTLTPRPLSRKRAEGESSIDSGICKAQARVWHQVMSVAAAVNVLRLPLCPLAGEGAGG
jgi:hypothetical protein